MTLRMHPTWRGLCLVALWVFSVGSTPQIQAQQPVPQYQPYVGGVRYPDESTQRPVYRYYAGTYYYRYGVGGYGGTPGYAVSTGNGYGGCGCGTMTSLGANYTMSGHFVPGLPRNPNTRIDHYQNYNNLPPNFQPDLRTPAQRPPKTRSSVPETQPKTRPDEPDGFFRKPDFSQRNTPNTIRPVSNVGREAAEPGRVEITVPNADAKVWVEDKLMSTSGLVRKFVSPPLSSGLVYEYNIKVNWVQQGQPKTETRSVTIRPGDRLSVSVGG